MLTRTRFAIAAVMIAILSGCASAPAQHAASQCYWPEPVHQDCRELIEFNSWR
jgi:hypothetical protein